MESHTLDRGRASPPADRLSASVTRYLVPSLNDVVFISLFAFTLQLGGMLTNRDGDVGRHLRLGEWILVHRSLPLVDVFSHTSVGEPIVLHEWLAEIALALAHRIGDFNGVGLLVALLVALPWAGSMRVMLRRGLPAWSAGVAVVLGALTSMVHWAARPHSFTFVFVFLWVTALEDFRRGERRHLWALAPIMVLWANTHGAFVIGFVLVGTYLAGSLLEGWWRRRREGVLHLAAVLGATVGASLVNPHGLGLLVNSFAYLGEDFLLAYTSEYNSPNFHLPILWPFLAMILLAVVLPLPRRATPLLLVVSWIAFALYSFRNIPLFALICAPILAEALAERRAERGWLAAAARPFARWQGLPHHRVVGGALSVVLVGVMALTLVRAPRPGPFAFDPAVFPVEALSIMGARPPGDRVFNQFEWGGYILYCCSPGIPVFIDGQTDFYGPELTQEYLRVLTGAPGWEEVLEAYRVDWVIIPPHRPLAQLLSLHPAWREHHRDSTAVVYVRGDA